jgi:hypothetical protein
MITATAEQISKVIVGNPTLLRTLHDFLGAISGDVDADVETILEELPAAIAAHSPFEDHASVEEVVRREMLQALRMVALRTLPTKGTA